MSSAEVNTSAYPKDVLERLAKVRSEQLLRMAPGKPEEQTDAELFGPMPAAWLWASPQH
jgi:hypothetical protein